MAKSGYCSNEQILKSALKRYKNQLSYNLSPFAMYLEELIHYLKDHAMDQDFSSDEVILLARHKYKRLKKFEKERYVELAQLANDKLFQL
ncbi:hypothetical protein KR067_003870 [Drosophila pandora]|nr:hypothetical protein KR067_003870 [Drosophila pandora]